MYPSQLQAGLPTGPEETFHARMHHSQLQPWFPPLIAGSPLELTARAPLKLVARASLELTTRAPDEIVR